MTLRLSIDATNRLLYLVSLKYRVSQKWRTNYLLAYRGCLNVHEKNMENIFQTKKINFYYYYY
jgi:NADPH-dependent 7-cyano-7-deazaguanine reductase QueF